MRLLVCSLEDVASVNIRDRLLEMGGWEEKGSFRSAPTYVKGSEMLVTIEPIHLFSDDLDDEVRRSLGMAPEQVVFLSRHRAASGIPTLTVHPIGNFGQAEFGGRPGTLVPSAPDLMTTTLLALKKLATGLPFQVGFEVTHHGPSLSTPTMFIEIGSGEGNWGDLEAARAIARALTETEAVSSPKAIGVGGGHYAPRFTEVIGTKKVSFGHMIPNYFCDKASDDALLDAMRNALSNTENAKLVYIHKKSMSRSRATHIKELVLSLNAEAIESDDLEDR